MTGKANTKNTGEAVILGAAVVDIPLCPVTKDIFGYESYPLEKIHMTVGGDALNEATILSRLGHKCALVSMVGDDTAGHFIAEHCLKEGINTEGLRLRKNIDTSINIGLVTPDGERTFVTNKNGSLWKMSIEGMNFNQFEGKKLLSFASIFNNPLLREADMIQIFQAAKDRQMTICVDIIQPRLGETLDDIHRALPFVDYFFPNYAEAANMTGERELSCIADRLLNCGVKHVVIKTGKKGCFIKDVKQVLEVPAVKGIQAIDTIGAGDNFAAGFITGLLEGKSLRTCAELGNVVASISVEHSGATTGVQSREKVDVRMREYLQSF